MKLHHQISGSGQPLVILHGLFGSSDNWRAVAKQLASDWQVITVDLRNHGQSPHSAEQNYSLMADDLVELLDALDIEQATIIGHSVGGKVAMTFSEKYPERLAKLIVVDIAPKQYQDEHSKIFKALLALDLTQYKQRSELDTVLAQSFPDKTVRQFLLMNIVVSGKLLRWRINLPALFENYPHLLEAVCQQAKISNPTCFIRGGHSNYIQDTDLKEIKAIFTNVSMMTIEDAGHWVHAESPQAFITTVTEFLNHD